MKFDYPDWSTIHRKHWDMIIDSNIDITESLIVVEVGCFEGRSTVWFADKFLTNPHSRMYCIDTWKGGEEVERVKLNFDMDQVKSNFIRNISLHPRSNQILSKQLTSLQGLVDLSAAYMNKIDFIYLDGSHTQKDTLIDLVLALNLIKVGGMIVVDDYMNSMSTGDVLLRPKHAVDFVVRTFDDAVDFFTTPEKQAVIIRNK